MALRIAILEDSPQRIEAMRQCLSQNLPQVPQVHFFESAYLMIDWLGEYLSEVVLISLDHDLPLRDAIGDSANFGSGRQVADYLASLPPTCPVIVHSSNQNFAPGMVFALMDQG